MGSFLDILALAVVEIYGDFHFKFFAQSKSFRSDYLAKGLLGYVGVVYFLIRSLGHGDTLMYVNGMWDALSNLVESAAAYIILGERLQSPINYVGLLTVIVGIVLLKH